MTSLINSKEGEIIDSLDCTITLPLSVIGGLELLLIRPVEFICPFLTTPEKKRLKKQIKFYEIIKLFIILLPIADEILIT